MQAKIEPEFSSIGFEKPYNADYEGRPDVRIVSVFYNAEYGLKHRIENSKSL